MGPMEKMGRVVALIKDIPNFKEARDLIDRESRPLIEEIEANTKKIQKLKDKFWGTIHKDLEEMGAIPEEDGERPPLRIDQEAEAIRLVEDKALEDVMAEMKEIFK